MSGKTSNQNQKLQHVQINLLDNSGRLPARSGLNWGHRPEYNRNQNEAYIRVPKRIDDLGFFPVAGIRFILKTDDGQTLRVTREQANSKAITTYESNSILGEYFRKRLGLPDGAFIKKTDLQNYGRTNIDFFKIDATNYVMDFHT